MKKRNEWRMLFGVENEYNTNALSYRNQLVREALPYVMVAAAKDFGGIEDEKELNISEFLQGSRSEGLARVVSKHEEKTDKWRKFGYTGLRLPNRMRIYVDVGHPEISTAECTNPRDLLLQQKASERMIELMRQKATEVLHLHGDPVCVYKNNSSGFAERMSREERRYFASLRRRGLAKEAPLAYVYRSWAMHENYLLPPEFFEELTDESSRSLRVANWLAFAISRIYGGSGKVGSECGLPDCEYQLFQRSDFISRIHGKSTMHDRALINTRDMPYADPQRYRRLHVIFGDALIAPWSIYLTYGATALFLKMLAEGYVFQGMVPRDPVRDFHLVSRDITGKERVIELSGTKQKVSALELQLAFLKSMERYVKENRNLVFADTVEKLRFILDLFESEPEKLRFYLDSHIKLAFLETLKEEGSFDKTDLQLEALDYHDMNPQEGHYFYLERKGLPEGRIAGIGSDQGIVSEAEIERAMREPPEDSRAYFGGKIVEKFPDEIQYLSWGRVSAKSGTGDVRIEHIVHYDPWFGTREEIEDLLKTSQSLSQFLHHYRGVV